MKIKSFFLSGLIAMAGVFNSCSSEDDTPPHVSGEGEKSSIKVMFNPPTEGSEAMVPHYAILSMQHDESDSMLSDHKLLIFPSASGFYTEPFDVNFGSYTLDKFIVYDETDKVIMAAPYKGSARAGDLSDVLPRKLTVCCETPVLLSTDVLPVGGAADAIQFGYSQGAFGTDSSNAYVTMRFQSQMSIGSRLYDSLKSHVKISAWNDDENSWRAERILDGVTQISVPVYYRHYKVEWTQWGSTYDMTLTKEDLYNGEVLLNAEREARRLTSETEYLKLPEGYTVEKRIDYAYNSNGRLTKLSSFQKQAGSEELVLTMEIFYEYEENKLKKIRKIFAGNAVEEQFYHYLEDGRLKAIDLNGTAGSQIAEWIYDPATAEFQGVQYSFENGHSFVYNYQFKNGNVIAENYAGGSNNSGGSSTIFYDQFINPYFQFGITDYFLRYSSRNNVNGKNSTYAGSFPSYVPKVYTYNYSPDGYPLEREIIYEAYGNNEINYRTKTVFEYE